MTFSIVSDDSSLMITSDLTSDNSDNGQSSETKDDQNRIVKLEICSFSSTEFSKTQNATKKNSSPAGNKNSSSQITQASLNKLNESDKQDANNKKASRTLFFKFVAHSNH